MQLPLSRGLRLRSGSSSEAKGCAWEESRKRTCSTRGVPFWNARSTAVRPPGASFSARVRRRSSIWWGRARRTSRAACSASPTNREAWDRWAACARSRALFQLGQGHQGASRLRRVQEPETPRPREQEGLRGSVHAGRGNAREDEALRHETDGVRRLRSHRGPLNAVTLRLPVRRRGCYVPRI